MTVAVIGANGFLGRALVAELAAAGITTIRASHHGSADIALDFEKPFEDALQITAWPAPAMP